MSDVKEKLLFQMTGQEFIDLMKLGIIFIRKGRAVQLNEHRKALCLWLQRTPGAPWYIIILGRMEAAKERCH